MGKRRYEYEEEYPASSANIETKKSRRQSSPERKPKSSLDFSGRPRQALSAMQQHYKLVSNYIKYYGGSKSDLLPDKSNWKSDLDVVRENNRFMWDSDEEEADMSWNQRVSKKYWDRLNKEYWLC